MAAGATATIKGGLFETNGFTAYTQIQGRGPARRRIAQYFGDKGLLAPRAAVVALDGAAAGGTASKTYPQIEPNSEQGGKRTVLQISLINRITTAGDITEFNRDFFSLTSKTTKTAPVNKNGNPLGSAGFL